MESKRAARLLNLFTLKLNRFLGCPNLQIPIEQFQNLLPQRNHHAGSLWIIIRWLVRSRRGFSLSFTVVPYVPNWGGPLPNFSREIDSRIRTHKV